jgi:hypothetical protein
MRRIFHTLTASVFNRRCGTCQTTSESETVSGADKYDYIIIRVYVLTLQSSTYSSVFNVRYDTSEQ